MYLYQSKQYIHVFIDLSLLQFRTQLQMSELLSGGKMDFASEHGLGQWTFCIVRQSRPVHVKSISLSATQTLAHRIQQYSYINTKLCPSFSFNKCIFFSPMLILTCDASYCIIP